ncbi:N-6 DNA methylase [Fastidiosibacter lacustris]|uniref:N-6 DNA methylase n=1 Tax=Fastidiosibacter lacustris TaxID=2056695 RepID=UPI000E351741|nr:N-6 DNA methylase [Fastidiosibacter lacustris]
MTKKYIYDLLSALGFTAGFDKKTCYVKTYQRSNYQITVDLENGQIDYGEAIRRGDDTTSNLTMSENLVVLECVDRLLEKGYQPKDLILEKRWKLGRTARSGKADITVEDKNGKTLLIIECKTWGNEYNKECKHMQTHGGQLFSYFQQDKNARFLCLYTSCLDAGAIAYQSALLNVEDATSEKIAQQTKAEVITYGEAKNVHEMLSVWKYKSKDKMTFLYSGLFEDGIESYNPGYRPIKIADLKDFRQEDKGKVFNQFEEILRHNNISDRSNAFNRMISLILAKIVDEAKTDDAIADFQVKEGIDDAEALLERLQSLYAKAMKNYLNEEVIDYKLEDIKVQIAHFPRQTAKDTLYRIYKELKFYQNNEFAFKEVYNKKLFEENVKVLEEVVKLLQKYRFKYDQKAQFLGDFFELMLESGYKQSEGQFFTPTPIAKFIVSSIPLKVIVHEKLQNGEKLFLPKVIDFACGSGHFLTEAIEEIATLIQSVDEDDIKLLHENDKIAFALKELQHYKQDMRWAGEYIFGIEKDYRLARTAQVACFMHGDGDANIIFGDGLEQHLGRLNKQNRSGDNTFDVLIANPPYTIKDFKKHLKLNAHDFELWEHVSLDSDDIEVFFIERMKQLLRPGGMAGIILPSSILSNTGAYIKARELLLQHFEIKAIVEFGGKTFGATSTNTVTLFLKKRSEDFMKNCRYIAEDFILENRKREGDFINSAALFESYVAHLNLKMLDYQSFITRSPNESVSRSEFYKNYQTWFNELTEVKNLKKKSTFLNLSGEKQAQRLHTLFFDFVLEIESEKFFYFLLTHRQLVLNDDDSPYEVEEIKTIDTEGNELIKRVKHYKKKAIPQKTLLIKTGTSSKEQEQFLGYKFSERRGYKGISFMGDTLLFDAINQLNPKKVNSYIYKNFLDESLSIDKSLTETISLVRLRDCINFEKVEFDKRISSFNANPIILQIKYPQIPLHSLLTKLESGNRPVGGVDRFSEGIPSFGGEHIGTDGKLKLDEVKFVPQEFYENSNKGKITNNDILICKDGALTGKVALVPNDFNYQHAMVNEHVFVLQSDENKLLQNYLFHFLYSSNGQNLLKSNITGQAQGGLNKKNVLSIKIPVPPLTIQQKIIAEIEVIDARVENTYKLIEKNNELIAILIDKDTEMRKISELTHLCTDKVDPINKPNKIFNYLGLEHLESNTGRITNWEPSVGSSIKSTKNAFKAGQVLYGKLRPYLNKVVIPHFDGVCSTDIIVLDCEYPILLQRVLLSAEFVREVSKKMSGVNLPRVKVKDFLDIKVSYPRNPDNISRELEKLEIEIKEQQESIANAEQEKKSVLTKYLEA